MEKLDCMNGDGPIFSIRRSVSIGTMINLDGDSEGGGDGVGMCKQNYLSIFKTK